MPPRPIVLSPQFARQFQAHIAWIAERSPKGAARVATRIRSAIRLLLDHPELGRSGRMTDTRELVVPRTKFM